ncbi:MAG: quinolinate synthase NadA [bacterium]|jgi:quinolinate synthase|nr:quinolinate synthase NadA [bacterium]MDD4152466.1 quinolinate synthase NadA [bacterium]
MSEADIIARINELRHKRNAVILAHNYQLSEIQDIADFVGDSLDLSRRAAAVEHPAIVFCGVYFMAETAKILSPAKTVLIPDREAGCPMADMISVEQLRELKAQHPKALVVAYVNSSAAIKAESYICCTSANAVAVVDSVPSDEIIFVPDKSLGDYVARRTDKKMIIWNGFCPTHHRFLPEKLHELKAEHPAAIIMVHPECSYDIVSLADEVLSTGGMLRFAHESHNREFIVGTEIGLLHRLRRENPDKVFHAASEAAVCPNMKKITLEKLLWSLEDMQYKVEVPEQIRISARIALDRMLEVG